MKRNNADISIAGHNVLYNTGGVLKKGTDKNLILNNIEVLERMLYDENIEFSIWNKLFKKELFYDVQFPIGQLYEEVATTYKLILKSKKIAITNTILYNYIVRADSITTGKFNNQKMDLIKSTNEMCIDIKNKYPNLEQACNRRQMFAYLSTLSQMVNSKVKPKKELNICLSYVKLHSREVLKDKRIPRRDRIALISLKFGFTSFTIMWNIYRKLSKRI